ncbi:hypothetical protein [Streptomyces niveus]|uniref:hypothetical protein n=1 Tax=Streptomyces niveus TaxID=193462 RepID=UPI00084BD917|nr:hypothetical protein [Streptomyces niveus]
MTFERVRPRVRAVPPITADLPVAAGVALFTASDAAVNDPEHRQADAFTWLLVAVTGAACAGWALYGHIGELLNELAVHRIVREALTNVGRHSGVRRAAVSPP